jgi:protease-4
MISTTTIARCGARAVPEETSTLNPEPSDRSGTTRTSERQGPSSAALFFRRLRRRGAGGLLAVADALSRWRRARRPFRVLRIELSGDLPETPGGFRLRDLGRPASADLLSLLAVLRSAREDAGLEVVLVEVHGLTAGWGSLQSLRRALLAVRAAGKPVWAYLTQPGMRDYYVASAASRVHLAPAASFDATGLASEVLFLKGALDKLGVEAQLTRAGRFKSAAEPLTRTDMSPEHREMAEALLDDIYEQLVGDVAAERHLTPDAVRAAFADGPLLAPDALARGLVDELAYPDQVRTALAARCGDRPPIDLGAYRRRRAIAARRAALDAPTIGVLTVSGAIGGESLPGAGTRTTGWRGFRRVMCALAENDRIAAVLLRIDSPGGSGLASDLMWREIVQARQRKPVIVSMGDVAASGGYYLAAGADYVTAEPATLTGSIGVLAGKPVLRGLYDRLGLTKELVVRGNASRHSDYLPLDDENLGRLRQEAEAFYGDFVGKVAAGRNLPVPAVEAIAQGRVWTGRQAQARGLVDSLGGIEEAVEQLKRRLGLPETSRVALARPRVGGWRSRLVGRLAAFEPLSQALDLAAPWLRGERVLAAMPFLVRFLPDDGGSIVTAETMLAAGALADEPATPAGLLSDAAGALVAELRAAVGPPLVF